MRRYSLLSILTIVGALTLTTPAAAQEVAVDEPVVKNDTLGIHPWKVTDNVNPNLQHWSLFIDGGFNIFDGDFHSERKNIVWIPTVGGGFEYNFNCTWGIGAEYHFSDFKVPGADNGDNADLLLKGYLHRADAFVTFDIFNAWRPQNQKKLFALNLILGGGPVWYRRDTYYGTSKHQPITDITEQEEKIKGHTGSHPECQYSDNNYRATAAFLGGASFEFNITRELQLGLRATYSYFTEDGVDYRYMGNNNDGIFDMTLMLRWKIQGRPESHVRNMAHTDIAKGRNGWLDGRPAKKDTVFVFQHQIDTVYSFSRDTLYSIHRDTLINQATGRVEYEGDYHYVYFANDDATIDETGMKRIQEVANILLREPTACVEVSAYCDNTGTEKHNIELSDRRARNVVNELVDEFNIDRKRVQFISNGILRNRRSAGTYAPNRRAEMHIMTQEDFRTKYGEEPLISTVRVIEGQTLRQLARKYYNNPACWYYIYQANSGKLTSPSELPNGVRLRIPELNDEQKKITDEKAQQMFDSATKSKSGLNSRLQQLRDKADSVMATPEAQDMLNRADTLIQTVIDAKDRLLGQ